MFFKDIQKFVLFFSFTGIKYYQFFIFKNRNFCQSIAYIDDQFFHKVCKGSDLASEPTGIHGLFFVNLVSEWLIDFHHWGT